MISLTSLRRMQLGQGGQLALGLGQGRDGEFLGDDGQVVQGPGLEALVHLLGGGDGDQVADGEGDDVFVAFVEVVLLFELLREGP